MPEYPRDLNAPGAIEALLAAHRARFGNMRMEADDDQQDGRSDDDQDDQSHDDSDDGKDWRREAEKWKSLARKHENTVKDLRPKVAEADRLRQERETESEKAVREAREQATAEERTRVAPRLVSAEFRAAAKGVLTADQTAALLEDLDLTKYLTDTGEVDTAKVEKKVTAFAPDKGNDKRTFPDLGQGHRSDSGKPSVASAKDDYLESRRKKR